ncbi:hypothetical protein NMG60_11019755 [Bertholletia excelsa]
MKSHFFIFFLNAICIFIFFLLLSQSMSVQGLRPLHDRHPNSPSWTEKGFIIINRAYSGPSHGGAGH